MPDCGDSAETGDAVTVLSSSFSLSSLSIGDTKLGDLFSLFNSPLELVFFVLGTSCSLKPSPRERVKELVSKVCGFGRSGLSCAPPIAGEAELAGVVWPDAMRFCVRLFSWYAM
jgi:hypothetical protein